MKRTAAPAEAAAEPEDLALWRAQMRGVQRSPPPNRAELPRTPPAPLPTQRLRDERAVLQELARAGDDGEDFELEDDTAYLRPGLPRDILRKLRRTHWRIQDHADLHGLTADEAAAATAAFLADCVKRGVRCVRIVHGKGLGSRGGEPVLKRRIRRLLARRSEVLAFVEPRAVHGGGGAVLVLLEG